MGGIGRFNGVGIERGPPGLLGSSLGRICNDEGSRAESTNADGRTAPADRPDPRPRPVDLS